MGDVIDLKPKKGPNLVIIKMTDEQYAILKDIKDKTKITSDAEVFNSALLLYGELSKVMGYLLNERQKVIQAMKLQMWVWSRRAQGYQTALLNAHEKVQKIFYEDEDGNLKEINPRF